MSGFFTPPPLLEILRARGHKIVLLMTESPYEDPRQLDLAPYADVTLLNDPVTLDKYRQVCPVAEYVPHAYRPSVHYPRRERPEYDLAFSGTGYQSRIEFFTGMGLRGLKVALAGNWIQLPARSQLRKYLIHDPQDCLDNESPPPSTRSAEAGHQLLPPRGPGRRDRGRVGVRAAGDRDGRVPVSGFSGTRGRKATPCFPMLPTFTSAQQAGELLRWALKDDAMRDRAARSRA